MGRWFWLVSPAFWTEVALFYQHRQNGKERKGVSADDGWGALPNVLRFGPPPEPELLLTHSLSVSLVRAEPDRSVRGGTR